MARAGRRGRACSPRRARSWARRRTWHRNSSPLARSHRGRRSVQLLGRSTRRSPGSGRSTPRTATACSRRLRAGKLAAPREGRTVPGWGCVSSCSAACRSTLPRASMHAVASELTRARGWRRARVPAALGALATIAMVATLAGASRSTASDPIAACDGGVAEIDRAWSAADRARLQTTLAAVTTPYARARSRASCSAASIATAARGSAQHRAAVRGPSPRRDVAAGARSHGLPAAPRR